MRLARLFQSVVVCALMGCLTIGCASDDAPSGPGDGVVIDVSTLTFTHFRALGYDADGEVETGLVINWTLAFESTTSRDCRIQYYRLTDQDSNQVYRRNSPTLQFVLDNASLSDKEVWVPLDKPSSSGDYVFSAFYETGEYWQDSEYNTHWTGPLSTGSVSREFTIAPAAPE